MNLPAPNLDSRRFDDLVREARARIPRYTPEWTNFNDSDPGMTLVKLHAWMTETILYELNRVPDLNYIKFLDLLGIVPRAAEPARTELTFLLEKLDSAKDPLSILIPRLTKVAVDDPALKQEVLFETDRTLTAINASVGALIVPTPGAQLPGRQLATFHEEGVTTWPHSFDPFGKVTTPGTAMYLGLLLRPIRKPKENFAEDRFPAGPLDVYADAVRILDTEPPATKDAPGEVVKGPIGLQCPTPGSVGVPVEHIEWHVFTGDANTTSLFADQSDVGWTRLSLSTDETRGVSGSGHLIFAMPTTARPLDPSDLASTFWSSFSAKRPPRTKADVVAQLKDKTLTDVEGIAGLWQAMGATPAQVGEIAACQGDPDQIAAKIDDAAYKLDPKNVALDKWLGLTDGFGAALPSTADGYRTLYWIRARLKTIPPGAPVPAAMRGFHLNTVSATQAATRLDDVLGRSNARPAQVFTLPKTPVLIDPATGAPDLTVEILDEGQSPEWVRVDDFYQTGPDDPHYLLDPGTGQVTLGGRIPVAGAQVIARRYRVGGGATGNVGPDTITKIKGRLRGIQGVHNIRAAHDGSDAESLDHVKLRAPHDLRMRDRAMSAQDFADLALQTPGVTLHKAFALGRRAVNSSQTLVEKDGAVSLIVLPVSDAVRPQPDEDQKRAICRWLEPRRLITTELHVIGPRYVTITRISARLTVSQDHDLGVVQSAVYDSLVAFLSPIVGGDDGTGWAFGQDVFYADLYERILAVDGVRRASELNVEIDGTPGDSVTDIAAVPEGSLPSLSLSAIDMVAYFD